MQVVHEAYEIVGGVQITNKIGEYPSLVDSIRSIKNTGNNGFIKCSDGSYVCLMNVDGVYHATFS